MHLATPPHPIDEDFFEEVFIEELDSWFNADIACCDKCYESFLKTWPMADVADDYEFQRNQIPLDCFYEGSRLGEHFTLEQFERLVTELPCPRCDGKLGYLLYPYNLPFNVPKDFEESINSISVLARDTPFLLLKNRFASDVFECIQQRAKITPVEKLDQTMFRGRSLAGLRSYSNKEFDFPPPEFVGEGRYNHAGIPVLYLADCVETCFHELREEPCAAAEICVDQEIKILDLVDPIESNEDDTELLNALVFSALLSTPSDTTGYNKPAYVFSRFVADCARDSGFDGIRYPSTRLSEGAHNLAIWNRNCSVERSSNIQTLSVFDGDTSKTIVP